MAYCGPKGLPLSEFLSWDQADQDAALSWQAYEARRCSGCGTHPDEGPKHFHVDVCATCVQLEKVSRSEDAKAAGAHVVPRSGTHATCSRCRGEIEANSHGR
ncbi:hypothetical protein [Isoptericola aurantiacus]|uniref:hypothetical protein n=1 Tax=Isoptericola aurantiacus TaxID=3377839 RepID=UPI00383A02A0